MSASGWKRSSSARIHFHIGEDYLADVGNAAIHLVDKLRLCAGGVRSCRTFKEQREP
jgi:hypothetical protein